MTSIVITRDDTGRLVGVGEKDKAAYSRLKKRLAELEQGEIFQIDAWFDRSHKFDGYHFIMLREVYEAQEFFDDYNAFRDWVTIGAGHAVFFPAPNGETMAIAKSVSHEGVDGAGFKIYHENCVKFLRSLYATRRLWPMVSDPCASEMIESILKRVEEQRQRVVAARKQQEI